MSAISTAALLIVSNLLMTAVWYGHLRFRDYSWGKNMGLFTIILISWGMALFEYIFQVPANKCGFKGNVGPFSWVVLKTKQAAITLIVFTVCSVLFFKEQKLAWSH